jgi:hypothetical protein
MAETQRPADQPKEQPKDSAQPEGVELTDEQLSGVSGGAHIGGGPRVYHTPVATPEAPGPCK